MVNNKLRLHVHIQEPEDIIAYLGKGERHWKKGYSAQELAECWFNCDGIPRRVREVLAQCPDYSDAELIDGFFERSVDLRTSGYPSHTDLMVVVGLKSGTGIIAVEGKVEEPFGQTVGKWNDHTDGKERRLSALCASLGLEVGEVQDLRYQLLHRTASAIYEAQRYRTDSALMLVHSFSERGSSFSDFAAFTTRMGIPVADANELSEAKTCEGVNLRLGWVADRPAP